MVVGGIVIAQFCIFIMGFGSFCSIILKFISFYFLQDIRRRMWPEHARHPAFINYLKKAYDYKQLEAIEVSN